MKYSTDSANRMFYLPKMMFFNHSNDFCFVRIYSKNRRIFQIIHSTIFFLTIFSFSFSQDFWRFSLFYFKRIRIEEKDIQNFIKTNEMNSIVYNRVNDMKLMKPSLYFKKMSILYSINDIDDLRNSPKIEQKETDKYNYSPLEKVTYV